jgi:predicted DsbA family dithiol-disulfide isomerase
LETLQQTAAADAPGVSVHWRSFELRPKGSPPLPPEYRARIEAGRPQLQAIARERYDREMNPGPFGVDSRPALIGAKYAESMERGPLYHDAVMRAYWQQAQDIGDRTVLADLAEQVGLDRNQYLAALDDPAFDAQVSADIDLARAYGLNGVPALVFADRYLVSGAQPAGELRRIVDQIASEIEQ